ncbi:MAG: transcriptional regulator [Candidatus Angelobacter sp. Gp1-AA117]|nr:MAG: transcriptional regulator [Candidatus Angelobacter sp. Gp1-AA117]
MLQRLVLLLLLLLTAVASAQQWQPLGPDGGGVRSFAYDPTNPDRMFLGTSTGRLYISTDGGHLWSRFAQLGSSDDMVLDNIVIDPTNPQTMYVAAWSVLSSANGELFRTRDGGRHWETLSDLQGKSLRALAIAPSDSKILVAGALDGIFRTKNSGDNWERISPENHAEIKNIESVAIDPANPDVVYAGTWHLPWKTEDGGKNWRVIKKGVIEDSDVFSIIIDPVNPAVVYASACSGIYKSESGGEMFRKIQGIPYSARRTRVLQMDPANHNVVYAGTTEGLWKTSDAGATWKRMTASNVVINDVFVDPKNAARVLLATDRIGVLVSKDGARSFQQSNRGFVHRQVASVLVDRDDSSTVYAGLLNDKEFGGVFVTHDSGQTWYQISDGLEGRDIFVLRQADDGSLLAGTNHGILQLGTTASTWQPLNVLEGDKPVAARTKGPAQLMAPVSDLALGQEKWYAATSAGLLISANHGSTWRSSGQNLNDLVSISVQDRTVVAATRHEIIVSVNSGESWLAPKLSSSISAINAVQLDGNGNIWIAAPEGAFRSSNLGNSWEYVASLPLSNVVQLQYEHESHSVLALGSASTSIFESTDNGRTWQRNDSGWLLRDLHSAHGKLAAATAFDGVIIQPESDGVIIQPESRSTTAELPRANIGNQ